MTTTSGSSTASTTPPNSKSGSMKRSQTMSITKEIEDNISAILGPGTKVTFKSMLKLEIKNDKQENRLLVFSTFRLYIFTVKGSAKLDCSYNYVDVSSIESSTPTKLLLGFQNESRHLSFVSCDPAAEEVNTIVAHLCTTLKTLFPHCPLEMFLRRVDVEPRIRFARVLDYLSTIDEKARYGALDLPCGGFSSQYSCFCDFYGVPFREEVAWDIDTIYASQPTAAELSIVDFEHLDPRDLAPIIAALAYNGYFRKFRVSNVKITAAGHSSSGVEQICDLILNLVRKSSTIEEIYLDSTGIRTEFVNKLFTAIATNPSSPLKIVDLSGNALEDKGLRSLVAFIAKKSSAHLKNASCDSLKNTSAQALLNDLIISSPSAAMVSGDVDSSKIPGLSHLNLSKCSITSKGVNELSEALYLNKNMLATLGYLNLSENSFKDDLTKLCNFLAQPNSLTTLDLSGTDCSLDVLFGALLHGCTQSLVHLNLAHNQFSAKKSSHKDPVIPSAIKQFFSAAISLRTVNLSHNKLPSEVLKSILLGLTCNESASDIRINLASNDFKSGGGAVLETTLSGVRCVSALDLSDNSLDMDLIGIMGALSKNKSIKFLSIGRNFANIKPKHLPKVLDAFVQTLQEVDCALESLSLADSKLRAETSIVLNALGSNQSLVNVDVSGNVMGLSGARTLAKALQVNTRLETIYLDRNSITTQGFFELSYALERNYTLKYLPIPVQDMQAAMLKTPERTEAAINKIQESIRRNNLPQTALLRSVRLAGSARSNFLVDTNLFAHIERNSAALRQALNSGITRPVDQSARFPSVDSIDITLNSDTDGSGIGDIDPEALLHDASQARTLCTKIQEVYTTTQTVNGFSSFQDSMGRRFSSITIARPIEANIQEFAKELRRTFEAQIISISELMITRIQKEFAQVFRSTHGRLELDLKELYTAMLKGAQMPPTEYFHLCLTESGSSTWSAKLESVLHQIAAQMCNRVLIEIGQCLTNAQKSLSTTSAHHSLHSPAIDFAAASGLPPALPLANNSGGRSNTPGSVWLDSGSPDSTDILNIERQLSHFDGDANNAIATPKQQNQRRQNVYLPKLRPQSVLDGTMQQHHQHHSSNITADDVSIVSEMQPSSASTLTAGQSESDSQPKAIQHLTKLRPKMRKTRAPTRVALVTPSASMPQSPDVSLSQSPQLDEGLDSFFGSSSSSSFLAQRFASSSQSSLIGGVSDDPSTRSTPPALPSKPLPQPRKQILRKFGFKQNSEQTDLSSHVSLKAESNDFVRSASPTFVNFSKHVSLCTESEIGELQPRTVSPLPALVDEHVHSEILAEMRAKQEAKRSHASTPQDPNLTFVSGLEKRVSPIGDSESNNNNGNSSIAKRATMFGELKKSPSRGSINVNPGSGNHSGDDISPPNSASISGPRQRPKSVVGLLSAKFELPIAGGNK